MKFRDIRTVPPGGRIATDICIVGAGPVGLTIASELVGSNRQVLVIESGGREPDTWADSLNEIESIGALRVMDQTLVRNRGLGGTSRTWSGRLASLEKHDFAVRDWVPNSGWPINYLDLEPYLERTLLHSGGVVANNTDQAFLDTALRQDRNIFNEKLFCDYLWSYSQDALQRREFMRFGPRVLRAKSNDVKGLLNATVTEIEIDANGRSVTGIEVMGPDGGVRRIQPTITVLCAGGIENARILLASRRTSVQGVGNTHDQVGRYLMDHPRGPVGIFKTVDSLRAQRIFGSLRRKINGKSVVLTRGVALSPEIQAAQKLVGAACWLNGHLNDADPFTALRNLIKFRGSLGGNLTAISSNVKLLAQGMERVVVGRSPLRKLDRLQLECIVEQPPYFDSRVTLADRLDAYGVPISRIDWKVGDIEARSVRILAASFCNEARIKRLPVPELEEWVTDDTAPMILPDVAHPMGTTRMSNHPACGVVDRNCRVHGVTNLFVSGSSVFATSGHANPTQIALALAIRLADHLKSSDSNIDCIATSSSISSQSSLISPPLPVPQGKKQSILVTGATGKIGTAVVEALIERGFGVRALTSRIRPPSLDPRLCWVSRDLRQGDLDFSAEVKDCAGIIHLGAELKNEDDMHLVNVEATHALAQAAEAAGVRFFAYASSVSVYGSQYQKLVTEDSPTLTADRDVPSEYWGNSLLRTYGRTKIKSESAIKEVANHVEFVIFRPTVVVNICDVRAVLSWGLVRRAALARRNLHHIFVGDVAAAFVWALERSLDRAAIKPGVEIFNLADNTVSDPTGRGLFAQAAECAPNAVKWAPSLPSAFDWGKDIIRYRSGVRPRRPLGMMHFSGDRLASVGFKLPIGMTRIRSEAINLLKHEVAIVGDARTTAPPNE